MANLNLKQELISPGRHNRPGTRIRPTSITIHNTDNADPGANASAHSRFVRETGYYMLHGKKHWVSWHCTVDGTQMIQQVPFDEMAYHAGGDANQTSIAIEICMNSDGNQAAADENAVNLTAALMRDLGIDIDHIRPHQFWTGKNCPVLLLDNGHPGQKWRNFLNRVSQARNALPAGPGLVASVPENLRADIDHRLIASHLHNGA
jgi:N-acetylmuramoyl-L-alanine amidase